MERLNCGILGMMMCKACVAMELTKFLYFLNQDDLESV